MVQHESRNIAVKNKKRIALAVAEFLPISQVWIWRQMNFGPLKPSVVLTRKASNRLLFDFSNLFVADRRNLFWRKVKSKLWFLFKQAKPVLDRRSRKLFKSALLKNDIGLVHAHFGTTACEMVDLCKSLQVDLIVTFHAFDVTAVPRRWPGYRKKLLDVFEHCSSAIAISEFIARQLILLGCPQDKIVVNYLGIPIDEFPVIDRRSRIGKVRFLHLGRITEKKGVPDLIRAFVSAFPDPAEVELLIIGMGEEAEFSKQLAQELNPVNVIQFKEAVKPDEVKDHLNYADVFVLNSRTDSQQTTEGLPISLLEAMATGLPVISTQHAGIPEAVLPETGFLVAERDQKALVEALRCCLNRKQNHIMGLNGRKLIEEKFSATHCGAGLQKIYQQVLA